MRFTRGLLSTRRGWEGRALRRRAAALAVTAAASLTALILADTAQAAPPSPPPPVKLTCRVPSGLGFANWDIRVQRNADGTARSAALLGNPYLTGGQGGSVRPTDPPTISIGNGGRSLHFHGRALYQLTGTRDASVRLDGAPPFTCDADFSFPNPATTATQLLP